MLGGTSVHEEEAGLTLTVPLLQSNFCHSVHPSVTSGSKTGSWSWAYKDKA